MIRSIGIALALAASSVTAGELVDCYNDETDTDMRNTSSEPKFLRITEADLSDMLARIREHESRAVANAEEDPTVLVSLGGKTSESD